MTENGNTIEKADSVWRRLRCEASDELYGRILPFWTDVAPDRSRGGYYGSVSDNLVPDPTASKGLVMHARLLWFFSSIRRLEDRPEYRDGALRALDFLENSLKDPIHGGYWWRSDAAGEVEDRNKVVYGQAFALYGLSEYLRVEENPETRDRAEELFTLLETKARDEKGGYLEILTEDWAVHPDGRLSPEDIPCHKSMNTNLHVLEAYTAYYRVEPSVAAGEALKSLCRWFASAIFSPRTGHLQLFLDSAGRSITGTRSFGHDVEASWLIREAARVSGDIELENEMEPVCAALARSTLNEGFILNDGGLDYEQNGEHRITDRHWWVQAEALVGFRDRWECDGNIRWAEAAMRSWNYIRRFLSDERNGEWFWGRRADGSLMEKEKSGLWKTPYHNGRACMELMERISS